MTCNLLVGSKRRCVEKPPETCNLTKVPNHTRTTRHFSDIGVAPPLVPPACNLLEGSGSAAKAAPVALSCGRAFWFLRGCWTLRSICRDVAPPRRAPPRRFGSFANRGQLSQRSLDRCCHHNAELVLLVRTAQRTEGPSVLFKLLTSLWPAPFFKPGLTAFRFSRLASAAGLQLGVDRRTDQQRLNFQGPDARAVFTWTADA